MIISSTIWRSRTQKTRIDKMHRNIRAAKYDHTGHRVFYNYWQFEKVILDCTHKIAYSPNIAGAYYERGNAYYDQRQLEEAISDYTQVIAQTPYVDAYYNRGNAYYDQGQLEKAISDYTQVIARIQNGSLVECRSSAYNNRGNAYYDKGELGLAISDFIQAVALSEHAIIYFNHKPGQNNLKTCLLNIKSSDDLSQIKKYDLLGAIKKLTEIDQIPLLEKCLNRDNPLGVHFWKQEGINECSPENGTLIEIRRYLAELYVKQGRIKIGKITNTPSTMFNPGQTQPDRDRPDPETIHQYRDRKFL
jgi:tetratricopeptide (TPR) repeat protein